MHRSREKLNKIKLSGKFQLFLFFVVVSFARMSAQDVSFVASVDRSSIGLGEQFQITFTLSGGNPNAIRGFRAPDLNKDFLTLAGPNQSTSLQIVNGNYSSTVSYSYILQPRKMGKFSIPPATISYQGQEKKSNSVAIEVTIGSPKAQQNQQNQQSKIDVPLGDELFLRATVDKDAVYVGEALTVTYKVYTRIAVQNFALKKQPRTIGFWSEEFPLSNQLDGTIENVNGKQYKAYVIRRVALYPTQAGSLEIDPLEITCMARVKQKRQSSGDNFFDRFFDDPFFDSYQSVQKELKSPALKIQVKKLPDGQPPSFHGAVGEFTMNAALDKQSLKTNESASLKVKIEGRGNIKLLEPPQIVFPTDIDHYDPKMDESVNKEGSTISGAKTFEYLLIPRYPGERTIQPVEFSYFDLKSKKYVTLRSGSFTMQIEKGKTEETTSPNINAKYVDYLTQDVRPLKKPEGTLRSAGQSILPLPAVFIAYLIPIACAAGLILFRRKYNREHQDVIGMKMKKATRVAEKKLSQSKLHLDANRIDEYYLEIARALWGYVQDRFAIPTSEASREFIIGKLQQKKIDEDTIRKLDRAIELTEYARYSPTRAAEEEMRNLYFNARDAIIAVEQRLKG